MIETAGSPASPEGDTDDSSVPSDDPPRLSGCAVLIMSRICAAFGPVRCQKRIGGPSDGALACCLIIGG